MSVCLVTGAAGFIGSHLVERLLGEGYPVIGVDAFTPYYSPEVKRRNLSRALAHPGFQFFEADLAESSALVRTLRPDFVFHLAGQPGVRASWGPAFPLYTRHNVNATQSLLDGLREAPPKRLLLASSSSVYGVAESYPVVETQPVNPISPYGVTKLAAEKLCYAYSRQYSISTAALRLFTVYGPRQRPDMALSIFMQAALRGLPVDLLGSGEELRDYTYVDDAVDGCMAAMHPEAGFEIINLAGGSPISLSDSLDVLARVTGCTLRRRLGERQAGDPPRTHASIEKARDLLGYAPKWSFEDGLRRQWEWFLSVQGASAPSA